MSTKEIIEKNSDSKPRFHEVQDSEELQCIRCKRKFKSTIEVPIKAYFCFGCFIKKYGLDMFLRVMSEAPKEWLEGWIAVR